MLLRISTSVVNSVVSSVITSASVVTLVVVRFFDSIELVTDDSVMFVTSCVTSVFSVTLDTLLLSEGTMTVVFAVVTVFKLLIKEVVNES